MSEQEERSIESSAGAAHRYLVIGTVLMDPGLPERLQGEATVLPGINSKVIARALISCTQVERMMRPFKSAVLTYLESVTLLWESAYLWATDEDRRSEMPYADPVDWVTSEYGAKLPAGVGAVPLSKLFCLAVPYREPSDSGGARRYQLDWYEAKFLEALYHLAENESNPEPFRASIRAHLKRRFSPADGEDSAARGRRRAFYHKACRTYQVDPD